MEGEIHDLFHNLGEVAVELGYDTSKKWGGEWRRATITYDKIGIEKSSFWSGKDDLPEESLKLLPRHARLQNMTYSSLIKVEARVQVFTQELTDKAKAENVLFVYKNVQSDETKVISVGRNKVKSKICWLSDGDKSDSLFDYGGYFVIKGTEKGVMKAINVNKVTSAGCIMKFWIADWFAQLNNKMGGDLKKIRTVAVILLKSGKLLG